MAGAAHVAWCMLTECLCLRVYGELPVHQTVKWVQEGANAARE